MANVIRCDQSLLRSYIVILLLPTLLSATRVETWNFTRSHTMQDFEWPPSQADRASVLVDLNSGVKLICGSSKSSLYVRTARMSRDADDVRIVALLLDKFTLDQSHILACSLADEWHVPRNEIDRWYESAKRDVGARGLACVHDRTPSVDIEMMPSFDDNAQWTLLITFGWVR